MPDQPASKPLVSIGVPVYNGEQYLAECLESIHKQTYPNWECYVINNRSTDRSLEIAESFAVRENRFKVITNEVFVGMTDNFNNTMKPVSKETKYFKVVCADDWIFPEYLEKMVQVMEKYPTAGFCSSYRLDNTTVSCQGLDILKGSFYTGKDILHQELLYKFDVTGSETTVLYRIEALRKLETFPVIFSDNSYHFDTELAFALLNQGDLAFVFQILSYTRRHKHTFTSQISNRFNTALNLRESELFKYKSGHPLLEKEYKKVRKQYAYYWFNQWIRRNKECLAWHRQHLAVERKFKAGELFKALCYTACHKILIIIQKVFNQ